MLKPVRAITHISAEDIRDFLEGAYQEMQGQIQMFPHAQGGIEQSVTYNAFYRALAALRDDDPKLLYPHGKPDNWPPNRR